MSYAFTPPTTCHMISPAVATSGRPLRKQMKCYLLLAQPDLDD